MDLCMDNLICTAQGYPAHQQRVSELTICVLKEISPYWPDEVKDLAILKKALARDIDWSRVKEILRWVIDTNQGTLTLSSKQQIDLFSIMAIPITHQCI